LRDWAAVHAQQAEEQAKHDGRDTGMERLASRTRHYDVMSFHWAFGGSHHLFNTRLCYLSQNVVYHGPLSDTVAIYFYQWQKGASV
jgi:hypothetical protein